MRRQEGGKKRKNERIPYRISYLIKIAKEQSCCKYSCVDIFAVCMFVIYLHNCILTNIKRYPTSILQHSYIYFLNLS